MKASYLGAMGYAQRYNFPTTWPIPPIYHDPETSVRSYQEGIEECEFAEEMGFDWVSFSEHHYSGRIATGTPAGVGIGFKPPKFLQKGDVVAMEVDGIGRLTNPVQ